MEAPLPPPTFDFSSANAVTLLVGLAQDSMLVNGNYLARSSDFFAACLKKGWAEGESRVVKLPEESISDVAYYLDFLYKAILPTAIYTSEAPGQLKMP